MAGTAGLQDLIVLEFDITGDATGGDDYVIPRGGTIIDAWVVCTAANASGTLTLAVGGNAVTGALTCAVLDTLTRAATLDQTYTSVSAGDTLTVTANGAGDRGKLFVSLLAPVAGSTALT